MSVISATGAERLSLDFQPVTETGAALSLFGSADPESRKSGSTDVQLHVSAETRREAASHDQAASRSSSAGMAATGWGASGWKPRMKSAAFDAALAARTMARSSSRSTSNHEPI